MFRHLLHRLVGASASCVLLGCEAMPPVDPPPVSPPRCTYAPAPLPPSGAAVEKPVLVGAVAAGTAEGYLDLPVGTPLSGYNSRMRFLGGQAPDFRQTPHAKAFVPSAGVQTRPATKSLYLRAGEQSLLLVKADLCLAYDRLVFDLESRVADLFPLGSARGRVIVAASHSHAAPGTYHGAFHLTLGADLFDEHQYQRLLSSLVQTARAAIQSAAPAKLGAGIWDGWDPRDEIYSDRRREDDSLPGPDGKPIGPHKEPRLLVLRVDRLDGKPLALLHSFPIHGTVGGGDNPLSSIEASGHIDLAIEQRFAEPVLVMHLQGPGGDASPRGKDGLRSCDGKTSLCTDFARMESLGELAAPRILSLYQGIKTADRAALEIVTRSVYDGRDLTVRGNMTYAPFVRDQEVDTSPQAIYTPDGAVRSPITQFNVESGAGLCGEKKPMLPVEGIPGATGAPYASCADLGAAMKLVADALAVPAPKEGAPSCETTRTTLSALRLDQLPILRRSGDPTMPPSDVQELDTLLFATLPGEPVSALADLIAMRSPLGPARTFVLGYGQGHVGYLLGVENWLKGGYEPSINLFGPLEGEWLAERAGELLRLAHSPVLDDGEAGASPMAPRFDRLVYAPGADVQPPQAVNAQAGTVPSALPEGLFLRQRQLPASAQPASTILRGTGLATFVFYGGDPEHDFPTVTLEQEQAAGVFAAVRLPGGRLLGAQGRDVLLTYTPQPIAASPGQEKSHLWAVEWQAVGWDRKGGVADVFAAPTGTYRFRVSGRSLTATGLAPYALTSQPFRVAKEAALTVTATRKADVVGGRAYFDAPHSFRLLSMDGPSDGKLPPPTASTVVVTPKAGGAGKMAPLDRKTGEFTVDVTGADASQGFAVVVTDGAGNLGTLDVL